MFYGLPGFAQEKFARATGFGWDSSRRISSRAGFRRIAFLQGAGLIALVLSTVWFNGCSAASAPGNNNNTSAANSTNSSLMISATLPAGTVGSAYSGSLAVTGGTAPYVFSMAFGQLPQGVQLTDNTGAVSGTPAASGSFSFAVSVADATGASKQQALQMTVANAGTTNSPSNPPTTTSAGQSAGTSLTSLQHSGGWGEFGQGPPKFIDCSPSPCDGISFSMTQGVSSPSLSGQATEYYVGGSVPFSDALWNNHLIGPGSSQGMPDGNQTMVPALHNFTYDVYFYGDNLGLAQALEFDINQFFGNMGFIFGHECRIASGNEWDVWDNQNARWVPTGIPCNPNSNSWNHLTIKVQRTSNNDLVYQSITLNGATHTLNWTFPHGSSPGWYGLTINYQMDGNSKQDSYNVYLDNLTFTYE
ncbi:MAG: Ig domain-containing protein [Candidatus Sulfotelmatobacter sp.]